MSTTTPNYGWILPGVNDPTDQDLWGGYLNSNISSQDTIVKAISNLASGFTEAKTADYTLLSTDNGSTILVDATSGNVTITGDATLADGFHLTIVKSDSSANTVTFKGSGSQTVNGAASVLISNQYDTLQPVSNDSNWFMQNQTSLPLASAAETLTGTSTTKAITPGGFAGNKSLGTNGYYKFPGGFIVQWGEVTNVSSVTSSVTFPVAFPTACVHANIAKSIINSGANGVRTWNLISLSTTGFSYDPWYSGSSGTTANVYWFAIGY
jgi:hypothetical protein